MSCKLKHQSQAIWAMVAAPEVGRTPYIVQQLWPAWLGATNIDLILSVRKQILTDSKIPAAL